MRKEITDDDEDIVEVISRTIKPFRAFGSKVITCTAANRKWETVQIKKENLLELNKQFSEDLNGFPKITIYLSYFLWKTLAKNSR